MIKTYLIRRADSGKLSRHLRGSEKRGFGLETISFSTIVTKDESRRRGLCSVCVTDKGRKKML